MKKFLFGMALLVSVALFGQSSFSISGDPSFFLAVKGQCTDPTGNVYLIGNGGPMAYGLYFVKFDSGGNTIWEKEISDTGGFYNAHAITADANSIYIAGSRQVTSGTTTSFIMRLNTNGQFIWKKDIISPGVIISSDALCSADGGCVVAGTMYTLPGLAGTTCKMDSTGNVVWSVVVSIPGFLSSFSGVTEGDGCIYLCGDTDIGPGTLTKISPGGALLWTRSYSFSSGSIDLKSCQYHAGKIYTSGEVYTNSGPPYYQFLGIMDTAGNCILSKAIMDVARPYSVLGMSITSQNNVLVSGIVYNDGFVREFDSTFNFIRGIERFYDPYTEAYEINGRTIAVGYESSTVSSYLLLSLDSAWTPVCTNTAMNYTTSAFNIAEGEYFPVTDTLAAQPGICTIYTVSTTLVNCTTTVNVAEAEPTPDRLYPNPADAQITLEFAEAIHQTTSFSIINVLGQSVMQMTLQPGTKVAQIDVSGLAEGSYFILHGKRPVGKFAVAR